MASVVVDKFFSIFWSNEACRSIFLLHKEQLLEKDEIEITQGSKKTIYYSPRFVVSNSLIRKDLTDKLQQRLENMELELGHNLATARDRNFDQAKIEGYLNRFLSGAMKEVTKRFDSGKIQQIKFFMEATAAFVSEKKFLKFLKKYRFVPNEVISIEGLVKHFESVFKAELSDVLSPQRVADILSSLDQVASYYQNAYVKDLIKANNFYTDVLYDKENYKSRITLLDMLYEAGVLLGGKFKAFYECTECDPGVFNATVAIKVTPSKLRMKCPSCSGDVFYVAPYELHEEIFSMIKDKDGLLSYAIKNLLERRGLTVRTGVNLISDVEADVIVQQPSGITDIFEVKVFKTDRPEDTIQKNLEGGLRLFLENRLKLVKTSADWANVQFHFVTNIDDEAYYGSLRESFKSELNGMKMWLYSPELFKKTFSPAS